MGNCLEKRNRASAEIRPSDYFKGPLTVKLHGSPSGASTSLIRIALLYKGVPMQFIPSENPNLGMEKPDEDLPVIQYGSDTVKGSSETLLHYIDDKFPNPPLLMDFSVTEQVVPAIVLVVKLQHKSMVSYIESLVKWAEDLSARGMGRAVDPAMGSSGMELKKFGRSYSQLLELMLEHAQMEERVVFPVLEKADRGLSRAANEDHARDLPVMNGIKEVIKSIGVLEAGSPDYQEALVNLSTRLNAFQEHCSEHFEHEEKALLPLLEAMEMNVEQQNQMVEQCLEVMESTHSHLFHFLILGLFPHDVMQYLGLITRLTLNKARIGSMLSTLISKIEGTVPLIRIRGPSQLQILAS